MLNHDELTLKKFALSCWFIEKTAKFQLVELNSSQLKLIIFFVQEGIE